MIATCKLLKHKHLCYIALIIPVWKADMESKYTLIASGVSWSLGLQVVMKERQKEKNETAQWAYCTFTNMDTQIFKAQKAQKTTERHAYADFCFEQCDICQSRPVLVAGCAVVCL